MLDGQVALVTGASRGIGAAIVETFAANGARAVALTARDSDRLDALARALKERYGTEVLSFPADVRDEAATKELYKKVLERFGQLDVLAANAGILTDGLLGMVQEKDVRETLDINVAGVFSHVQAASRLMRKRKKGSIILTGSIIGRLGNKGQSLYAASKAALIGLTLSAAKELGESGMRINAVAPGFIETDMTRHLSAAVRDERLRGIALGRTGTASDVADVVLFLASDLSRYVSGQVIGVDGCMTI